MYKLKPIFLILILFPTYLLLLKPFISYTNEYLFYPILKYGFPDYNMSIKTHNSFAVIVYSENFKNETWIRFPFGPHYIIPAIILVYNKMYDLVKYLTLFRIAIFLTALLLLSTRFNYLLNYIPNGPFYLFIKWMGLIFILLAIKKKYNYKA